MKMKEFKGKQEGELRKMLASFREKLRKLNFQVVQKESTQVREIRKVRQDIARVLTHLNASKKNKVK